MKHYSQSESAFEAFQPLNLQASPEAIWESLPWSAQVTVVISHELIYKRMWDPCGEVRQGAKTASGFSS